MDSKLKIEVAAPNFFTMPTKRMVIETPPQAGRTYFVLDGKIVAVARRSAEAVQS